MIPNWRKFVAGFSSFLDGVTAESLPMQVAKFPKIGDRMPNPPGLLLDPQQRTKRAGHLFAVGLSLALIDHGWQLVSEPGISSLRFQNFELNPFQIIEQLDNGKLSMNEWFLRCRKFGISDIPLAPAGSRPASVAGTEGKNS